MALVNFSKPDIENSLFSIRGSLDGNVQEEFIEKLPFIGVVLGQEEFFLPLGAVAEIIMLQPVTYVSRSGQFIEGVINLRGTIMPVINLRKLAGFPRGHATPATRIIVIKNERNLDLGFIVDGVTYVSNILPSEVEANFLYGKTLAADILSGIAKNEGKVIGILDEARIIQHCVDGSTKRPATTP